MRPTRRALAPRAARPRTAPQDAPRSPESVAGRAAEPVAALWERLTSPLAGPGHRATGVVPAARSPADALPAAGPVPLPSAARRWSDHAVPPEARGVRRAVLEMSGQIRMGRWMPFVAVQVLAPPHAFVWVARTGWRGAAVTGYDRFDEARVEDAGEMRWLLAGRVPVMRASGHDVSRSAAGRLAGEAVLVPPSLATATWEPETAADRRRGTATYRWTVAGEDETVTVHVDEDGRLLDAHLPRWGNPDGAAYGRYPFGVQVEEEATFGGVTIPSVYRAGWWWGSSRWEEGEFFRARITRAVFLEG